MSGKEFLFKVLLLGDGAVGKTSIREQYMGAGFSGSYTKTIGSDFASKRFEIDDMKLTLQIFDLAGQDAYRVARKSFYKGGQAAFLVFDLQDPDSLYNLNQWVSDAIENSGGSIGTFVILGNKADLIETRQVSNEMAIESCKQLATNSGLTFVFLETSAKTGMNIDLAFDIITTRLLRKFNVDKPLDIPSGIEMIAPGQAPAEPVAPVSVSQPSTGQSSRLDELENRLVSLEDKFNKLTQIVRDLVQKQNQ